MTQYANEKKRRLVELLYKKTVGREITWGINVEKQLYATIAGRSLFVYYGLNEQGEDLVIFNLFG